MYGQAETGVEVWLLYFPRIVKWKLYDIDSSLLSEKYKTSIRETFEENKYSCKGQLHITTKEV